MTKRKFTQDFKKDACELALSSSKSKAQVARDLGIKENVLYNWLTKYQKEGSNCFDSGRVVTDQEAELSRLRAELAETRQERDILKKALTIFSKRYP